MLRFERLSISNGGLNGRSPPSIVAKPRAGSPAGGSIFTTSAPQSARTPPAAGPATHTPSSTTRMPERGPLIVGGVYGEARRAISTIAASTCSLRVHRQRLPLADGRGAAARPPGRARCRRTRALGRARWRGAAGRRPRTRSRRCTSTGSTIDGHVSRAAHRRARRGRRSRARDDARPRPRASGASTTTRSTARSSSASCSGSRDGPPWPRRRAGVGADGPRARGATRRSSGVVQKRWTTRSGSRSPSTGRPPSASTGSSRRSRRCWPPDDARQILERVLVPCGCHHAPRGTSRAGSRSSPARARASAERRRWPSPPRAPRWSSPTSTTPAATRPSGSCTTPAGAPRSCAPTSRSRARSRRCSPTTESRVRRARHRAQQRGARVRRAAVARHHPRDAAARHDRQPRRSRAGHAPGDPGAPATRRRRDRQHRVDGRAVPDDRRPDLLGDQGGRHDVHARVRAARRGGHPRQRRAARAGRHAAAPEVG